MKYKQGDLIIIYKGSPTFGDGILGQVIDRDPMDKSYAVASLESVFKEKGDVPKLLEYHVKWVAEDNINLINFDKPKKDYRNVIIGFCGVVFGVAIALGSLWIRS